jgi:serine protease Do
MSRIEFAARRGLVAALFLAAACTKGEPAVAQEQQAMPKSLGQQLEVPHLSAADSATAMQMATALSTTFRIATQRALPSVVYIEVQEKASTTSQQIPQLPFPFPFNQQPEQRTPPPMGAGSGFIFDPSGYILTNNHVVEDAQRVTVTLLDGRQYDAKVVGRDPNSDIAVVKIDPPKGEKLPVAKLADSDSVQVGDWVLALGNPLRLNFTVTAGIVSAKGRQIGILARNQNGGNGNTGIENYIQTDAAINPGNSGGPLVNLYGQVVGINSAIESSTGMYTGYGFAIPIDLAKKVADDLIKYGAVRRPQLGVLVGPVADVQAQALHLPSVAGALVMQVQPNTPAEKAGIKLEDVIVALDGTPIETSQDLVARLARLHPDQTVTLSVIRDGQKKQIPVTLGSFPNAMPTKTAESGTRSASDLLGFQATDWSKQLAGQLNLNPKYDYGAVVTSVDPYGPAAQQAGIQRGMLVIRINGQDVRSASQLKAAADKLKPGSPVSLIVVPPGKDQTPQVFIYRTAQ